VREVTAGPALADAVSRRLARFAEERVMARLWDADTSLWKPGDDAHERGVARCLGWGAGLRALRSELGELEGFAVEVRDDGFRHAVLLGMGGSSLAPEVLASALAPGGAPSAGGTAGTGHGGAGKGALELIVLDTTDPRAIAAVEETLDLESTVFIVASKSGGTVETASLHAYFYERLGGCCDHGPGHHFIAITDPETALQREAIRQGFRAVFVNPDDIGGRFSALSFFGLVPAALIGADLAGLLDRADAMAARCAADVPADENPALALGAWLAEAVAAGRDKLTLAASPGVAAFGSWAEQLVAESTGKEGTGVFVVDGESLGPAEAYGDDRAVVHLRLAGGADPAQDAAVAALEAAGVPVLRRELDDPLDVGGEFLLWELAVSVCCHALGIDPFDQPNVQESKDNTKRVLAARAAPVGESVAFDLGDDGLETALAALTRDLAPPAYVALHAWLTPGAEARRELEALRLVLRDRRRVATSAGFGPRFLHSTGQYHKGGPARGVFVQLVSEGGPELPVPGREFSFRELKEAQALGDLEALLAHGGRVLRVDLGEDAVAGLHGFGELLRRVLAA
jgi:glucose-6-phosphate isomerase